MKRIITYICTIIFSLTFVFGLGGMYRSHIDGITNNHIDYERVKISRIVREDSIGNDPSFGNNKRSEIHFEARILDGEDKGDKIAGIQLIDGTIYTHFPRVEEGQNIIVTRSQNTDGKLVWAYVSHDRIAPLIILCVILSVCLLIFGRMSGLNTLISLAFTILAVFLVYIPAILAGHNVYLWTFIIALFIVSMTLILVNGWNSKSLVAAIGCMGGVVVSGLILLFMDIFLKITGVINDESIYLTLLDTPTPLDLKAIAYGAMIIGAIGAIMDVAVNIAASLHEVKVQNRKLGSKSLFRSGMTIGRDILGTMMNTLVLAYIGSSLSLVLILYVNFSQAPTYLFNTEMIVVEILQSLIGSFGLLSTIPLSAYVASMFYKNKYMLKNYNKNK